MTNGTLTGPDGDGNYSYTPDQDFEGVANFNYLIKDGQGGSISNSVNLTVTAVNDAPIAEYDIDQDTSEGIMSRAKHKETIDWCSLPPMLKLIVEKNSNNA